MPLPWSKEGRLLAAVKNNNFYKVEELLNKKVDPNIRDMVDRHILNYAAVRGNPQIIELLLKSGADPNQAEYEGYTALMSVNNPEIVQLLIEYGANVDSKYTNNWTALMFSASEGDKEVVKILLDSGADANAVDNAGRNAMVLASINGHSEIVKLLETAQ
ncbi:ankyrin repeat domain-containing protein [Candidatus Marinimicrobia bacterium MT.SAG.3]|nr:ankyrin repeat domain-containing protein [Candidatus Marinimicrobia bacterium MT.SAG.3]